jgi:hypothetical protein
LSEVAPLLQTGHIVSADCDRSRWRRRENICAYILREKRGKRPFGQEKVQAEAARVAWRRLSLAKLRKSNAILAPASNFAPIFATEFCIG